jgi:Ser/Thr protein kinase RdoA (MazF antagonist)
MISKQEWLNDLINKKKELVYGLSKLYPILDIKPIKTESWNGIFKAIGENGTFCLKVINDFTSNIPRHDVDLMVMCQYLSFLSRENFEFHVPLIPSNEGKLINQILNYRLFIFPWIENFSPSPLSENDAQSAETVQIGATLLAKLHNCSHKYKNNGPTKRDLPHCFSPFIWRENIDRIFQKASENFLLRKSSQNGMRDLENAYNLCLEFINKEKGFFENDIDNQIMVHGDFRPENIFVGTHDLKIVDFDMCHFNYPEVDVAYGALAFSGGRWFYGRRNWDLINQFITTYTSLSNRTIYIERIKKSLVWVLLKVLSTSFKEEQLKPRIELLNEIKKN